MHADNVTRPTCWQQATAYASTGSVPPGNIWRGLAHAIPAGPLMWALLIWGVAEVWWL